MNLYINISIVEDILSKVNNIKMKINSFYYGTKLPMPKMRLMLLFTQIA